MDPIQNMPAVDALVTKTYTTKDWLNYYKNIWTRNHASRVIDMHTDIRLKAEDPNQMVANDDGREITVKERLEHRKILVQDAMELIKTMDKILALEKMEDAWGEEVLKVAADMVVEQKKEEGGNVTEIKEAPTAEAATAEAQPEAEKTEPSTEAKI